MDWYVVRTKPNHEQCAVLNLQRLGVETFCPKIKQEKVIRRRRRTVIGQLFPRYFFARFDVVTRYRAVNFARGVQGVVGFGAGPAVVANDVVEAIRSRLDGGCLTIGSCAFTPGQVVRIQEGPLRGFEGIFEREMGDQERVVLLLRALSYEASVVVELGAVATL